MIDRMRNALRRSPSWLRLRELQQEGFVQAWRRWQVQKQILRTTPILTEPTGEVEVRVLTWRRDWVNQIWALKSFYHFSDLRLPLFIHDGGLSECQRCRLMDHFPNATLIGSDQADTFVTQELTRRGLNRCASYRRVNPASRKLFDYAIYSRGRRIIGIDSDIVFFARPDELLRDDGVSRFNCDMQYAYSLESTELDKLCGRAVPPYINSGLFAIDLGSIDLSAVEAWLGNEVLYSNRWVTEQTLHAMLAARGRVELLPASYRVDTKAGLPPGIVCKHYPGFERPLLYTEGMPQVKELGVLAELVPAADRQRTHVRSIS